MKSRFAQGFRNHPLRGRFWDTPNLGTAEPDVGLRPDVVQRRVYKRISRSEGAMRSIIHGVFAASLIAYVISGTVGAAASQRDDLKAVVTQVVRPVMKQYGISGMAVGSHG